MFIFQYLSIPNIPDGIEFTEIYIYFFLIDEFY